MSTYPRQTCSYAFINSIRYGDPPLPVPLQSFSACWALLFHDTTSTEIAVCASNNCLLVLLQHSYMNNSNCRQFQSNLGSDQEASHSNNSTTPNRIHKLATRGPPSAAPSVASDGSGASANSGRNSRSHPQTFQSDKSQKVWGCR